MATPGISYTLFYNKNDGEYTEVYNTHSGWVDPRYATIIFKGKIPKSLLAWLQKYATKQ